MLVSLSCSRRQLRSPCRGRPDISSLRTKPASRRQPRVGRRERAIPPDFSRPSARPMRDTTAMGSRPRGCSLRCHGACPGRRGGAGLSGVRCKHRVVVQRSSSCHDRFRVGGDRSGLSPLSSRLSLVRSGMALMRVGLCCLRFSMCRMRFDLCRVRCGLSLVRFCLICRRFCLCRV